MQRVLSSLLLFVSLSAAAKPFNRVLVLTGGSMEFFTRLGVWSALQEEGWVPDVVITTCGSSLMGAFVQATPDFREARDMMFSELFYEGLKSSTRLDNRSGTDLFRRVFLQDDRGHYPHLFGRTILDVDLASPRDWLEQHFTGTRPRLIMTAARLDYGQEVEGKKWSELNQKSIHEVLLTDDDTAARLPHFESPLAQWSPRIYPEVEVRTGWELWTAARASFAEPYLVAPMTIDGETYSTGAIDILPVELAQSLGDDVIMTYTGQMPDMQARAFENLFGFKQNDRGRQARATSAAGFRWVDLSDDRDVNKENGLSPAVPAANQFIPVPGVFLRIKNRIPETYAEFLEKMQIQYDYGAERAREVLTMPSTGGHAHIRRPWDAQR